MSSSELAFGIRNVSKNEIHLPLSGIPSLKPGERIDLLEDTYGCKVELLAASIPLFIYLDKGWLRRYTVAGKTNLSTEDLRASDKQVSSLEIPALITDVYSAEETLTNKVWFGNPVYRKVIYVAQGPDNDVLTISHNVVGATKFITCTVVVDHDDQEYTVDGDLLLDDGDYCVVEGENILWQSVDNLTDATGYVILEYIK